MSTPNPRTLFSPHPSRSINVLFETQKGEKRHFVFELPPKGATVGGIVKVSCFDKNVYEINIY